MDELLQDLEKYEGDEMCTWMRMAWMLNPSTLVGALKEVESSGGERPIGATIRARVVAALNTVGETCEIEADVNQFCIAAAIGIARSVMAKVGTKPEQFDDDDAFIGGLFASVAADLLTQRIGGSFELAAIAAVPLVVTLPVPSNPTNADVEKLSKQMAAFATHVLDAHNNNPSICGTIGKNMSRWVEDPNEMQFMRLVAIFLATRKRVRPRE